MLTPDPPLLSTMSLGHCVTTGVPELPIAAKSESNKESSQGLYLGGQNPSLEQKFAVGEYVFPKPSNSYGEPLDPSSAHSSLDYEPRFPFSGQRWIGEVPFLNRGRPPVTTGVLPSPFACGYNFPSNDLVADSMNMYLNLYRMNLPTDSTGISSRKHDDRIAQIHIVKSGAPCTASTSEGFESVCMPMGNPANLGTASGPPNDPQFPQGDAVRRSSRFTAHYQSGHPQNSLADSFEQRDADEQLEESMLGSEDARGISRPCLSVSSAPASEAEVRRCPGAEKQNGGRRRPVSQTDLHSPALPDPEKKKIKRLITNRESAKRSRNKRDTDLEYVEQLLSQLREEGRGLAEQVQAKRGEVASQAHRVWKLDQLHQDELTRQSRLEAELARLRAQCQGVKEETAAGAATGPYDGETNFAGGLLKVPSALLCSPPMLNAPSMLPAPSMFTLPSGMLDVLFDQEGSVPSFSHGECAA